MVDTSVYENLPEDGEAAFLVLEAAFREECESRVRNADQNEPVLHYYAKYIDRVISVISELRLNTNIDFGNVPPNDAVDYSVYSKFVETIEGYVTALSVRLGRKKKYYSVKLDGNTKSKLISLVEKIKETIDKLEVSAEKNDALHARASALEAEISRDRTRFEVVGAFWVEACGKFGEGVEKLEPLRKWLDPIGNLIGQAKQAEKSAPQTLIAATPRPKQIEDQRSTPATNDAIDDNIPF